VIRFYLRRVRKRFRLLSRGIHSADDAIEKLEAGACLLQLYTGFIYEGPALVKAINQRF
jgi:dihydroorotate dehydrogenase